MIFIEMLQLVNTGKERAKVSLLFTWAVSSILLIVVKIMTPDCFQVQVLSPYPSIFYAEFYWRHLPFIRRACQRAIYVSISSRLVLARLHIRMFKFDRVSFSFIFYSGEDGVSGVMLHHKQVIILSC